MREQRKPFIFKIIPFLPLLEKVFLSGLAIGIILFLVNGSGKLIIQITVGMMGVVYFLSAFKLQEIPVSEDEKFDFKELLTWTIMPKILYIGSAVGLFGILVYTFQPMHDGYVRLLMSGGLSITIGLLVMLYAFASGVKHASLLMPVLLRTIPVMLIAFYIIYSR